MEPARPVILTERIERYDVALAKSLHASADNAAAYWGRRFSRWLDKSERFAGFARSSFVKQCTEYPGEHPYNFCELEHAARLLERTEVAQGDELVFQTYYLSWAAYSTAKAELRKRYTECLRRVLSDDFFRAVDMLHRRAPHLFTDKKGKLRAAEDLHLDLFWINRSCRKAVFAELKRPGHDSVKPHQAALLAMVASFSTLFGTSPFRQEFSHWTMESQLIVYVPEADDYPPESVPLPAIDSLGSSL